MVICIFVFMAIPFKAMTLVEGFTEVRPVNAVPVLAGLLFGPAGAWGCAFGNVIADLFGDFSWFSVLGFVGNFFAAYVPYRIWHITRGKQNPNVKSNGNLFLYIYLALMGAIATGIIIGCGLDVIFGFWSWEVMMIIVLNDFLFPVVLGLPILIVITSDDHRFEAFTPDYFNSDNINANHIISVDVTRDDLSNENKKNTARRFERLCCKVFAVSSMLVFSMLSFGLVMSQQLLLMGMGFIMVLSLMGMVITDQ